MELILVRSYSQLEYYMHRLCFTFCGAVGFQSVDLKKVLLEQARSPTTMPRLLRTQTFIEICTIQLTVTSRALPFHPV